VAMIAEQGAGTRRGRPAGAASLFVAGAYELWASVAGVAVPLILL
jgi:hypothetical protein